MNLRRLSGRAVSATILACALAVGCTTPAAAADNFYLSLLDRGTRELDSGRAADAEQPLRTACFGFLDEPVLLAEGLIQLGRAQAALGKRSDLEATLDRLIEIQDRFNAYSDFDKAELKSRFEKTVRASLPPTSIQRLSMFSPPAPPSASSSKQSLRSQRRALEKLLRVSPGEPAALWALARLENSDGKPQRAAVLLDRLLTAQPDHGEARCLRARIGIQRKNCSPALAGVPSCSDLAASANSAGFLLRCLVDGARWPEAREFLASLPTPRRTSGPVTRWAAKIPQPTEIAEVPQPGTSDAEPDRTAPGATEPEPEVVLAISPEERIRRLRKELEAVSELAELDLTMKRAADLAEEFPGSSACQHLAAEVAYRAGDWPRASEYFARGGPPNLEQPTFLFYMAVALFETGDTVRAADLLVAALPKLRKTPFVNRYTTKILGTTEP